MTKEGLARRTAMFAAMSRPAQGPQDRGLQERCITFGSPQLISGYQSYTQIQQTPDFVIVMTEMIHDARLIPLDGRPHVPSAIQDGWGIRAVIGKAIRWWSIRPTTNRDSFMSASSEKLHVIERFARTGPESLKYQITVDDPGTWTKPWSADDPAEAIPAADFRIRLPRGQCWPGGNLGRSTSGGKGRCVRDSRTKINSTAIS